MLSLVKKEFLAITGIWPYFKVNLIEDRQIRSNNLFAFLSEKIFDHPRLLDLLLKKITTWLNKDQSEFTLCLAGYIYYMAEDFQKSEAYFLNALQKSSRNLDVWLDLAFSLYHQNDKKQKLAKKIIFNHEFLAKDFPMKKITLRNIQKALRA